MYTARPRHHGNHPLRERSPMTPRTKLGTDQILDTAVMAPLTRLSKTVATANNLNHWFRHALTTMWAQPRGPVHLSLTHDALVGESAADYAQVSGFFAQAQPLAAETAETALKLLANRDRSKIAVLAGAGVEHDAAAARLK